MKKLLSVVAVAALLVTVVGASAQPLPKQKLPSTGGTVKTVTNDAAGKLASFVITVGTGNNARNVTVNVDAKTQYMMDVIFIYTDGRARQESQVTSSAKAIVVVGKSVTCTFPVSDPLMHGAAGMVYQTITQQVTTIEKHTQ